MGNPKIALVSDFRDYYDHCFSDYLTPDPDAMFYRESRSGMTRPEIYDYLVEIMGATCPKHGKVKELVPKLLARHGGTKEGAVDGGPSVVVYTDPSAHRGEGKLLMSAVMALAQYPDAFASQYIDDGRDGPAISYRRLRVGRRGFWLRYTSRDDWRSNCGDTQIEFLAEDKTYGRNMMKHYPLYAIDYVYGPSGNPWAIDFNVAPGLTGAIDQILTPKEVFDEIACTLTYPDGSETNDITN